MVLATMRAIKLKEEGRAEGREESRKEGRAEGRAEERKRWNKRYAEALAKFGVAVDGVIMLPQTPEVQRFLDGEPEEEEE